MKKLLLISLFTLGASLFLAPTTQAVDSLQIRPLMYRESLKAGETKRGYVDIANASNDPVSVHVYSQLFKQVADDGTLSFYDSPFATNAIVPDYTDFDLKAKESLHLGFTVNSTKLPSGDVFATLFARSVHKEEPQKIISAAQVGTLMVFENGTPGSRKAVISGTDVPWFQVGTKISGSLKVNNPANPETTTGFFPKVSITSKPWGKTTQFEGKLVYAGRTRDVPFAIDSNQFGLYRLNISVNDASITRYVFVITGIWRWLAPVIALATITAIILLLIFVKKYRLKRSKNLH